MAHPSAIAGFGAQADAYERGRPDYPQAAVDWLCERLGIRAGARALDLAAGTGKLTRQLVPTGATVVAVEPSDGMRAQLVRLLPEVEAVAGLAEELPFPDGCFDAVCSAQAFHWFANDAALAEIARVLKPGGGLGLVWNARDRDHPVQRALIELTEPLRTTEHTHVGSAWRAPLEASPLFGPIEEARFEHVQRLDADGLADRVGSISFVAVAPEETRREVLARARALAAGGEVELSYVTEVYAVTVAQ